MSEELNTLYNIILDWQEGIEKTRTIDVLQSDRKKLANMIVSKFGIQRPGEEEIEKLREELKKFISCDYAIGIAINKTLKLCGINKD